MDSLIKQSLILEHPEYDLIKWIVQNWE